MHLNLYQSTYLLQKTIDINCPYKSLALFIACDREPRKLADNKITVNVIIIKFNARVHMMTWLVHVHLARPTTRSH